MKIMLDFRLLTIALLTCWSLGAHAQLPCEFSWDSVIVGNSQRNFTTPAENQPFQGPCMAFAFNSAIETMYRIEHDSTTLSISLDNAYLDYLVYNWQKTLPTNSLTNIASTVCGNFPPTCNDEEDCRVWPIVNPIINGGDCFEVTREHVEYDDEGNDDEGNDVIDWVYLAHPTSSVGIDWYSVGQLIQYNMTNNFLSTDDLKSKIINNGPVVLRIDGPKINLFRNYGNHGASFHGYVVLGWKDVSGGTQWLLKDSWPGSAGFYYSITNPGIVDLIASNYLVAYQVSGISKNGQVGNAWPYFSHGAQCPPPPPEVNLNCWNGGDKMGCASVSGGTPPYSYQWRLVGSGGALQNISTNCVEIIGSGFSGSLYVTITDSMGQTAWDNCTFTNSGGLN